MKYWYTHVYTIMFLGIEDLVVSRFPLFYGKKCGNNQGIEIKRHTEIACAITLQWYIFNMLFLYRQCWKLSNACIDQLWWFSLMDYADFLQLHCLHVQLHVQPYLMCLPTHYGHLLFLSAFFYFPTVLLESWGYSHNRLLALFELPPAPLSEWYSRSPFTSILSKSDVTLVP